MTNDNFFENQKTCSSVKSEIVKKYFWAWAKVIAPRAKGNIAYIDLYSGPGIYTDGTKSTPILVLENALRDDLIKSKLLTIFNDIEPRFAQSLENAIKEIPNIKELKHYPSVSNITIGNDIVKSLKSVNLVPTLLFIDPWGYKGLTIDLIGSVLKDWGCDCIFFFNYNRINAGLNNEKFTDHINAIFGEKKAIELRKKVEDKRPRVREKIVLQYLKLALNDINGQFVLAFKFYKDNCLKTSHFIIFVSKNVLGYDIMKQIMAEESSYKFQGVATFEFNPHKLESTLFPPCPLDDLKNELLKIYQGKTLTVQEIYFNHNINTPYLKSNYKDALLDLESKNMIITNPDCNNRQKRNGKLTMGDNVVITFI